MPVKLITDFMGPDGCISNTRPNAGLTASTSYVITLLEPIWQKYCDLISRGDFWALIGKLSVEKADPTGTIDIPYYYGRVDKADCTLSGSNPPPAPSAGLTTPSNNLVQSFIDRMGLTVDDIVILSGAHTIGHVHVATTNLGLPLTTNPNVVDNAWDDTPHVFDNHYFNFMLNSLWTAVPSVITGPSANFWQTPTSTMIRLNSDISIAFGLTQLANRTAVNLNSQQCSSTAVPPNSYGCINPLNTTPPSTLSLVQLYAANNSAFLTDFAPSFTKMSNLGYGFNGSTGKLGSLTKFTSY